MTVDLKSILRRLRKYLLSMRDVFNVPCACGWEVLLYGQFVALIAHPIYIARHSRSRLFGKFMS